MKAHVRLPNGTMVSTVFLRRVAEGFMSERDFEWLRKLAETSPTDVCYILFEWMPIDDE